MAENRFFFPLSGSGFADVEALCSFLPHLLDIPFEEVSSPTRLGVI